MFIGRFTPGMLNVTNQPPTRLSTADTSSWSKAITAVGEGLAPGWQLVRAHGWRSALPWGSG